MEVILLENMRKLGAIGDVVRVKDGYARNYLLPQKKVLRATEENRAVFEARRAEIEAANAAKKAEAEAQVQKLEGRVATLIRQAGDDGRLYGSVSARDIAQSLGSDDVTVEAKFVQLLEPIKNTGIYDVVVEFYADVRQVVKVNVARSESEAELALKKGKAEAAPKAEEAESAEAPVTEAEEAEAATDAA